MNSTLYRHRSRLAAMVRRVGIREVARRTKLSTMRVSRFCDGSGGADADTLYRICDALDVHLQLHTRRRKEDVLDPAWLIV